MSLKKNSIKVKTNVANEPPAVYGEDRLRFFNSFAEMEEADAIEMSKFSSLEHLQHMTEFIKNAYKQELSNKMTDFKIFYK